VAALQASPALAAKYADALKTHAGAVAGGKLSFADYFSFGPTAFPSGDLEGSKLYPSS